MQYESIEIIPDYESKNPQVNIFYDLGGSVFKRFFTFHPVEGNGHICVLDELNNEISLLEKKGDKDLLDMFDDFAEFQAEILKKDLENRFKISYRIISALPSETSSIK